MTTRKCKYSALFSQTLEMSLFCPLSISNEKFAFAFYLLVKITEVISSFYLLNTKLLVPKRLKLNPMIVVWSCVLFCSWFWAGGSNGWEDMEEGFLGVQEGFPGYEVFILMPCINSLWDLYFNMYFYKLHARKTSPALSYFGVLLIYLSMIMKLLAYALLQKPSKQASMRLFVRQKNQALPCCRALILTVTSSSLLLDLAELNYSAIILDMLT